MAEELPIFVDNSSSEYCPPIVSQEHYNACSQFAGIFYILAYELNRGRKLPAYSASNCLAPKFSWNFLNAGQNRGSEFSDGWQLAKDVGIPSLQSYGGLNALEVGHWPSGYELYYEGMFNRVQDWEIKNVTTPEGIEWAKRQLAPQGDEVGHLLAIDFQLENPKLSKIPEGQVEAGKYIVERWGRTGGGHLMTCVGYDDRIGYDFNGDGQITNDIDITGDGKVDVGDWERGVFIIANSWGSHWANEGYVYTPYREFAVSGWERGRYMGKVVANPNYQPKLTLRLKFEANDRSAINLCWGAVDQSETETYRADSPLFRRQAIRERAAVPAERYAQFSRNSYRFGKYPPRGPGDVRPIEMGFDLTRILEKNPNPYKVFVEFAPTDPAATANILEAELIYYNRPNAEPKRIPINLLGAPDANKPLKVISHWR